MSEIRIHSAIAVLEDIPSLGLRRGQVGTVVEALGPAVWEVEFSDDEGRAYAMHALRESQLMELHYQPSHQAA